VNENAAVRAFFRLCHGGPGFGNLVRQIQAVLRFATGKVLD
jgi:hypothetical protein